MALVLDFLYHNFFGMTALVLAALSYQAKTRRGILLLTVFTSLSWVLYFLFQGALVSSAVCAVAFLRSVIFYLGLKHKWADHCLWLVLFVVLTIVAGIFSFSSWLDLIPIAAGTFINISMFLKKETHIRIVSAIGIAVWIANGIINNLYFALVSDCISLLSILIALIRYDLRKEKVKSNIA